MTPTLFIVQIVLAVLITIVVLLQKSSSIGLGAYTGSNESVFGAKGPTGFLTKLTFTLALLFIVNTLALGYFYTADSTSSVTDSIVIPDAPAMPEAVDSTNAPAAPQAPATTEATPNPEAPAAPSTEGTPDTTSAPAAPATTETK